METSRRKFTRLLSALDQLVEQEAVTVAAGDYAAVGEIQRRAAPLVAGLAEIGFSAVDPAERDRVTALMSRRQRSIELLESHMTTARADLMALDEGYRRVTKVAPVYGRTVKVGSTWNFRGRG